MPPSSTTSSARAETGRDKILDAARAVFAERGFDSGSIADIADRAGVAKSVMYHHFGSKAGVYEAIVEEETRAVVEHVAASLPETGPRLRAGIDAYLEFISKRPSAWSLLIRDAPADATLREVHDRYQRERADAVTRLVAHDLGKDAPQRKRKELYFGLVATAIRAYANWWYENQRVPREVVLDAIMDFVAVSAERVLAAPARNRAAD